MTLIVTSVSALALGVLYLGLTLRVIQLRLRGHVVLGDGGDRAMTKAIRGHANAAEQVPVALIVMGLAEWQGAPMSLLAPVGAALVLGRAAHGLYFARHGTHWRFRVWGMWTTIACQAALLGLLGTALVA